MTTREDYYVSKRAQRRRRTFTTEQRTEAVRLVRQPGSSVARVARDLDLVPSCLARWVKQAEIDDGQGPDSALTTEEKEELRLLRAENKRLRMEHSFLKKAAAFFAREGDSSTRSS